MALNPFFSFDVMAYHSSDRVLFKGSALRLQEYARAELMTSDHRPVYAVFEATIREIDRAKKEKIAKELVHSLVKSGGEKKIAAKGVEVGNVGARDLAKGDLAKGTWESFFTSFLFPFMAGILMISCSRFVPIEKSEISTSTELISLCK